MNDHDEPWIIDVPSKSCGVDADGVEWFKLSPEDYWGPERNWKRKLERYQRAKLKGKTK